MSSEKQCLPDVQATKPKNELFLPRVGVSGVKFPISVRSKDGKDYINTIATFDMFCDVAGHVRGANMSRYIEELSENWLNKPLSGSNFKEFLISLKTRQKSNDLYASASFEYLIHKESPVTKKPSATAVSCKFIGVLKGNDYKFILEVVAPVGAYCACSKAMSLVDKEKDIGKGSHAQRGWVTAQVQCVGEEIVWIEDLVKVVEESGSAPTFPLLKRPDEKYVTELGYGNAKFVEDICRDGATLIMKKFENNVRWLRVKTRNLENIHAYDAVSVIEITKNEEGTWNPSHHGSY